MAKADLKEQENLVVTDVFVDDLQDPISSLTDEIDRNKV
jgi:hypothetical protein